jgi:hypothetical protein
MCDASGAVPLSKDRFIVADDEDNVLRVYDANRGGNPLLSKDVSAEIGLPIEISKKTGLPKDAPETDLEAATRLGDLALWLTSHGRNSKGKLKQERLRLFATTIPAASNDPQVIGFAKNDLLDTLIADPRYANFGLAEAAQRAPKEPGGLNIEGMTERKEGGVWIGFRNPTPGDKALLVPLLNAEAMVRSGASPELGDPLLLDLGGLGVRSLSYWRGRYLIMAGHFDNAVSSRLYLWDDTSTSATQVAGIDFSGLNPEGFFSPEEREQILLLSDDGSQLVAGKECKKLKDSSQRSFRGVWVSL